MYRRRFDQPVHTLGKILVFDWDLFVTDPTAPPLTKRDVKYGKDYLVLRGDYSGRVVRSINETTPSLWGMFKDTRNSQVRVKCDQKGWGCVPRIGCWMERIDCNEPDWDRPAIVLLQARSIVGAAKQDELHVVVREGRNLVAQWTYKDHIIPETIELPRLEETLYDLANHRKAHPALIDLVDQGFYVCYEDDGWLLKCAPYGRVRWMRRSHIVQATICRCGKELVDAMFDDTVLRTLVPCRLFAGHVGKKSKPRPGVSRRSSSIMSQDGLGFDLADLMGDCDRTMSYRRMFRRQGASQGNFLAQDSQFMDAVRSWMEHGGRPGKVIVPNAVKWRYMIKSCAGGDDPYYLMEDVRILGSQWLETLNALPNSKFRSFSFSTVYYDATVKIDSHKLAHKALRVVKPKEDIAKVFERQILMNGGYFVVAVSRKGVKDKELHVLFKNIEGFVNAASRRYGYKARQIAMGVHYENMIFSDFRVYRRYAGPKEYEQERSRYDDVNGYWGGAGAGAGADGGGDEDEKYDEEEDAAFNDYGYFFDEEEDIYRN